MKYELIELLFLKIDINLLYEDIVIFLSLVEICFNSHILDFEFGVNIYQAMFSLCHAVECSWPIAKSSL